VTAIGLIFAVLTERVRWSVAFKTAVFMPMAISAFAAAVIWRVMDQKDPDIGAVNAIIRVGYDYVNAPGVLSDAKPSTEKVVPTSGGGARVEGRRSDRQRRLARSDGDQRSRDAPGRGPGPSRPSRCRAASTASSGETSAPAGGTPGEVEPKELGIPGVTVELLDASGGQGRQRLDRRQRNLRVSELEAGQYKVAIGAETFAQALPGHLLAGREADHAVDHVRVHLDLGRLLDGRDRRRDSAAIPRDVLEAARTDGGTEWQVFRRVTVPLLAPVLTVVFITMLINVLKVFDIVVAVAPGSVQDDANVLALAMWRTSFGGANDFGVGSAIAVFIFLL
jgi:alpha-glucoside transport system permease protein